MPHKRSKFQEALDMAKDFPSNIGDIARIYHHLSLVLYEKKDDTEADKARFSALTLRKAIQKDRYDEMDDGDEVYDKLVVGWHR